MRKTHFVLFAVLCGLIIAGAETFVHAQTCASLEPNRHSGMYDLKYTLYDNNGVKLGNKCVSVGSLVGYAAAWRGGGYADLQPIFLGNHCKIEDAENPALLTFQALKDACDSFVENAINAANYSLPKDCTDNCTEFGNFISLQFETVPSIEERDAANAVALDVEKNRTTEALNFAVNAYNGVFDNLFPEKVTINSNYLNLDNNWDCLGFGTGSFYFNDNPEFWWGSAMVHNLRKTVPFVVIRGTAGIPFENVLAGAYVFAGADELGCFAPDSVESQVVNAKPCTKLNEGNVDFYSIAGYALGLGGGFVTPWGGIAITINGAMVAQPHGIMQP